MRVSHLSLNDFRNYRSAEVSFEAGLNLVIGHNGQGKTNLAEAIAYFASLSSHRVSNDAALIRAGEASAVARMRVEVDEREVLLELQLNKERPNRAQVNRNAVRPRELTRWFSCIMFAPEDLSLVRGEPGIRRRFLDEAVVARQPSLSAIFSDYERVVKQRTALLRSSRASGNKVAIEATLEIWDAQLVELGTSIMLARRSLAEALRDPLLGSYSAIVQSDHSPALTLVESLSMTTSERKVSRETFAPADFAFSDVSRETLVAEFREALLSVRRQELERGVTLLGPHRDDALFELNGLPVKGYASHGESWSFALALRLALASLLRQESVSGDPVIILDDVFAELDVRRRNALMGEVSRFEQIIVTAAVEEDVPAGAWHKVRIEAGVVQDGGAL